MNAEAGGIIAAFALYLAAMVGVGLFYWRKTTTVSQFILGDRALGRFVIALSAEASDMSGWLLIGLPGLAYACGMQAGWVALGLIAGTYLNWKYIPPASESTPGLWKMPSRCRNSSGTGSLTVPAINARCPFEFPSPHQWSYPHAASFLPPT
ncbi:MAG: hypothetical protein M0Q92_12665 [Methanoregula sp.]|jgi:hypothetical protein|nr:hypothetical protein [Methanoregula sp.]